MFADQFEFRFGSRFGEKIIDSRFSGDGRGSEAIVARDHDGLDAHVPQVRESLFNPALDDVLEFDDPQYTAAVGDDQRGTALARDALHGLVDQGWKWLPK